LYAVREASADLGAVDDHLERVQAQTERLLDASRWREGGGETSDGDETRTDPATLTDGLEVVELGSLAQAEAVLEGKPSVLLDLAKAKVVTLRARIEALGRLDGLLSRTRAQQATTAHILAEVAGLSDRIGECHGPVDAALALGRASDSREGCRTAQAEATSAVNEVATRLEQLKDDAHRHIPFLAGDDAPEVDWDLAGQDAVVRAAVNQATAAAVGQLYALRQSLDRLAEQLNRPLTPPPQSPREVSPPATPVAVKAASLSSALSPSAAEVQAEQADQVEPLGLRRSYAHPRFAFTNKAAVDDVFGSSPAPALVSTKSQDERTVQLRAVAERLDKIEVDDWVDDEFLELPSAEEAGGLEYGLDKVEADLDELDDGTLGDGLAGDLDDVRDELRRKRGVSAQIEQLVAFRCKVEEADEALSGEFGIWSAVLCFQLI